MIRKTVNFIILLISLIICLGFLNSCDSSLWFKTSYNDQGSFGSKEVDGAETFYLLTFVSSLEELKDLCTEWNNPAFEEESEFYSSKIYEKIREYDEEFFADKILIIRSSFDAGPGKNPYIKSVNVEGTQLIVDVRYKTKNGIFVDVASTWMSLIEIKKSDVIGVTKIIAKQ